MCTNLVARVFLYDVHMHISFSMHSVGVLKIAIPVLVGIVVSMVFSVVACLLHPKRRNKEFT